MASLLPVATRIVITTVSVASTVTVLAVTIITVMAIETENHRGVEVDPATESENPLSVMFTALVTENRRSEM